jgi:serine/threonine protein kinase
MKTITRMFKSLTEEERTGPAKGTTQEVNKQLRKRFSPSVFTAWINSKSSNISFDEEIVIHERKPLPLDDYQRIAQNLCHMLEYRNGEELFENKTFLCNSSAKDCKIYTANTKAEQSDKCVIKVTNLSNKNRVTDVENELRLMKMCDHPNIVKLEGAIGHESSVWIIVKHHKYGSLTSMMEKWGILSEAQIAFIAKQVLSALAYLHSHNILHLDIKSDNVLVSEDLEMILTDFGVSVHTENCRFDEVRGTAYWMAPEVILSETRGTDYNDRADVWSFGILVWELMHKGEPPRFNMDPMDALQCIMNGPAPQIPNAHTWSPELNDFMYRILVKDPKQRWSAKQLLEHKFLKNCSRKSGEKWF